MSNSIPDPHYRTGQAVDLQFADPLSHKISAPAPQTIAIKAAKGIALRENQSVQKYGYLAMLAFTLVGSMWLEVFLKVGVIRRFKRVILSILPTAVFFIIWDAYAISRGHWYFDQKQILGIFGPLNIPLEEFLFFLVVPLAALLTIEAVRTVKKHWTVGDES